MSDIKSLWQLVNLLVRIIRRGRDASVDRRAVDGRREDPSANRRVTHPELFFRPSA